MPTVAIPSPGLEVGMMLVPGRGKSEKITKLEWSRKRLRVIVNDKYVYDVAGKAEVRL